MLLKGLTLAAALAALILVYRTIAFWGAGAELAATCHEGPAEAKSFQIEGSISNEFYFPSDPAPWCATGQFGGRSTGSGTGTIGEFEFVSDWCIVNGVLMAENETLSTEAGEIFLDEETAIIGNPSPFEAILRTRLGPPLRFDGVFTITGGTGDFEGATGKANLVGEQLGAGRTAMAACGVISYD